MKRKLTNKQKMFVKKYTDANDKETYLNAKQSAIKSYNTSESSAGQIGHNLLKKVEVIQAIEKRTLKKEDIQDNLARFTEKIEQAIDNVTVENVPLLKEFREYNLATAKLNGDLIEKTMNLNVNVDRSKDLSSLSAEELQNEVIRRMQAGYTPASE